MQSVLIGIPSYDGMIRSGLASALLNESRHLAAPPFTVMHKQVSLLAFGFNQLLASALNNRHLFTHFLMLHADVIPKQHGFLRVLLDEMEVTGADLLSVVLPIKDEKGLSSTALIPDVRQAHVLGEGRAKRRRLTLRELEDFPDTFQVEDAVTRLKYAGAQPALLVNTGFLLIDLREPWVEQVWFTINDCVWKNAQGVWGCDVEPEDWYYAAEAAQRGARIYATRKVTATHIGTQPYPNVGTWGIWDHDRALDGGDTIGVRHNKNGVTDEIAMFE